jgi:hypothetical protein
MANPPSHFHFISMSHQLSSSDEEENEFAVVQRRQRKRSLKALFCVKIKNKPSVSFPLHFNEPPPFD